MVHSYAALLRLLDGSIETGTGVEEEGKEEDLFIELSAMLMEALATGSKVTDHYGPSIPACGRSCKV